MKEIVLVYPTQLFEKHPAITTDRRVILIEDPRYFTDFAFHKQKILFHRASMKAYQHHLEKKDIRVTYITFDKAKAWYTECGKSSVGALHYVDPVDGVIEQKIAKLIKALGCDVQRYESPAFLTSTEYIEQYFKGKKKFLMQSFYIEQRKRLHILVTKTGDPVGGKWSFDTDNRKKYDKRVAIPPMTAVKSTEFHQEAVVYVNKHFADNPGSIDTILYPVTFGPVHRWLDEFLEHRLKHFGDYQDAIVMHEPFLFHSLLSPLINVGLLTPEYVVEKTIAFAQQHKTPINDLEGFIRQVIGWREFVRAVYHIKGEQQRTSNFFRHKRTLPDSFWSGTTGVEPIDSTIAKILKTAYAHHIERLMVLGNFMFMCEFDPNDVYRWFMELFIDAYDWVMVPNVYGMSQYADGGLMTTKPYFSSSNYLKQMSDYPTKGRWTGIFDALFWHFVAKHKDVIASMGRLGIMVNYLKKMKKETLHGHLTTAQQFLKSLSGKE